MRFNEFKLSPISEAILYEINMSPASLRQLASKVEGVKVGMEFELVVPEISNGSDDGEMEPDYDQDQRCNDFDEIYEFFIYDGNNSRGEVKRVISRIEEEFIEWVDEKVMNDWPGDAEERVRDYIESNYDLEEDEVDAAVEEAMRDKTRDYNYNAAVDEYLDERRDEYVDDPSTFLKENYPFMTNIASNFDLTWPYYTSVNKDTEAIGLEVARDFAKFMGVKINFRSSYHGERATARHIDGCWEIEPDGSIEDDDGNSGAGLEFVSPPLPVDEMLEKLKKVTEWCKKSGAYTNKTTGLHMNISLPGLNKNSLDFIKLALLMGDDHVASSFDRLGNTYAKSATNLIKNTIDANPEKVAALLAKMKEHLNAAASQALKDTDVHKYTSINPKLDGDKGTQRIEFRSPGNNWLEEYGNGKMENTLLRLVVALDAAVDKNKYKEEYAKKLYKILNKVETEKVVDPKTGTERVNAKPAPKALNDIDLTKILSGYITGDVNKTEVKNWVQMHRLRRDVKKGVDGVYWWRTTNKFSGSSFEVMASDIEEAKELANKAMMAAWGYTVDPSKLTEPVPIRRATQDEIDKKEAASKSWRVKPKHQDKFVWVKAESKVEAVRKARKEDPDLFDSVTLSDIEIKDEEAVKDEQYMNGNGNAAVDSNRFEVYNTDTNNILWKFTADSEEEALEKGTEYLATRGLGNSNHNVRRATTPAPRAWTGVPDERGAQYEIYHKDDDSVVHRLYATSQQDAYQKAFDYARVQGLDGRKYGVRPAQNLPGNRQSAGNVWWQVTNNDGRTVEVMGEHPIGACAEARRHYGEQFDLANIRPNHVVRLDRPPEQRNVASTSIDVPLWRVYGINGEYATVPAADEQEAQSVASRRYGTELGDPANYQITRIGQ